MQHEPLVSKPLLLLPVEHLRRVSVVISDFPAYLNQKTHPKLVRRVCRRSSIRPSASTYSQEVGMPVIEREENEAPTTESAIRVAALPRLGHLRLLEAESIHILREVASEFERPVMLYSIGKDSSVMLRLAQKAFYPAPIPFPLLHIDTGFKFAEMLTFRDAMARQVGAELLVWRNEHAIAAGTNPIALDTKRCCGLLKTQALLDALKHYNFDAAFGGARRDEEKSRAKERIYSFRDSAGQWDPKNQRPELWNLFNARVHPGEKIGRAHV